MRDMALDMVGLEGDMVLAAIVLSKVKSAIRTRADPASEAPPSILDIASQVDQSKAQPAAQTDIVNVPVTSLAGIPSVVTCRRLIELVAPNAAQYRHLRLQAHPRAPRVRRRRFCRIRSVGDCLPSMQYRCAHPPKTLTRGPTLPHLVQWRLVCPHGSRCFAPIRAVMASALRRVACGSIAQLHRGQR